MAPWRNSFTSIGLREPLRTVSGQADVAKATSGRLRVLMRAPTKSKVHVAVLIVEDDQRVANEYKSIVAGRAVDLQFSLTIEVANNLDAASAAVDKLSAQDCGGVAII